MKHTSRLTLPLTALLIALVTVFAGCGDDSSTAGSDDKLVVYSGRAAELVDKLYKKFEQETGVKVEVRYGDSPELAATLQEEGDKSPADVFYAQDAGAIGSVEALLGPLATDLPEIPARFHDNSGRWTGITGRARVLAYNTDRLEKSALPASVVDLTDPKWKGRIGIAPGNASFQAFVTAMRDSLGDEQTKQWLEGMKDNDAKTYENNAAIVEAIAKGEVDAGLVNHYYLYELKAEDPDAPVANHFFEDRDPGTLVNVSAAGILASAKHRVQAERFLKFLLEQGQDYFAKEAEEREYPLVAGVPQPEGLPPLDEVKGPDVDLSTFGEKLPESVKMIGDVGFPGT